MAFLAIVISCRQFCSYSVTISPMYYSTPVPLLSLSCSTSSSSYHDGYFIRLVSDPLVPRLPFLFRDALEKWSRVRRKLSVTYDNLPEIPSYLYGIVHHKFYAHFMNLLCVRSSILTGIRLCQSAICTEWEFAIPTVIFIRIYTNITSLTLFFKVNSILENWDLLW